MGYELLEATSSGMTHYTDEIIPLINLEEPFLDATTHESFIRSEIYMHYNFGGLEFRESEDGSDLNITITIHDINSSVVMSKTLFLKRDLTFQAEKYEHKAAYCRKVHSQTAILVLSKMLDSTIVSKLKMWAFIVISHVYLYIILPLCLVLRFIRFMLPKIIRQDIIIDNIYSCTI